MELYLTTRQQATKFVSLDALNFRKFRAAAQLLYQLRSDRMHVHCYDKKLIHCNLHWHANEIILYQR
jgi:hypothetical protein